MIKSFEVKNFKSIKGLSLKMRPFMVLVGPNGAGKTNIVQALQLFGALLSRGNIDPARELGWGQLIRREKKPARAGMTLTASVLMPADELNPYRRIRPKHGPQHVEAENQGPVTVRGSLTLGGSVDQDEVHITREELQISTGLGTFSLAISQGALQVSIGDDPEIWESIAPTSRGAKRAEVEEYLRHAYFGDQVLEDKERRVFRVLNVQRFFLPALTYLSRACIVSRLRLDASALRSDSDYGDALNRGQLGPNGQMLAAAVNRLRSKSQTNEFARILAALQTVYPRIEDVIPYRIATGRLTLHFKEKGIAEHLGQSNVSDGILHALALLVALEETARERGLLAIEEPENALHPWSVRSMIEQAQNSPKRQVLITTHSETVVNAVNDPAFLYIVENSDGNGTIAATAMDREAALRSILQESGQTLGDVWLDGTLGGVPEQRS